jgi:hypothetical protein
VPTEDGVKRDKRSNFAKSASANGVAPDRGPATLGIGQAESPATALSPENPILLSEVFDDCIPLTANPADQDGNEDLPRPEHRRHP